MDVLILNGALPGGPALDGVQQLLADEVVALGWRPHVLTLHTLPIAYCQGCFECWTRTPGTCKTDDAGRQVATAFIGSHVVVLLTPVTFGGYSSEIKKGLDRIIGLVLPFFTRIEGEVHHVPRYERYPALVGVGLLPEGRPEEERVFHTLVERNAINMHAPWHASRVLHPGDEPAAIRAAIRSLLAGAVRAA
jgi:hypothetical protein